jgi:type II secretory pathway predicted ATPase ExeA
MLPEYLTHWGFETSPFSLSPDPDMLFMSTQHQEALLRLKYGVMSNKGGVLLVSENAGDGKTSLLRRLVADLEEEEEGRLRTAFVDHPTLTVNQMVAEIARQLGVAKVRKEKIDNLNALRSMLGQLHRTGTRCLVIVDEGQMLAHRPDILQELRILLNFCVSDSFLLSFVISGQKPLEEAVKRMPEFWQRLPVRFFLRNLDAKDTAGLVRYRVRAAGQKDKEIFTPMALEGIHRASLGCPRVICSLADLSLLIGHSLRSATVDFREVSQAASDHVRSGEPYHYYSFLGSARRKNQRRCPGCRKFVGAKDERCKRCGVEIDASAAAPVPVAEDKLQCPGCLEHQSPQPHCSACGLLLTQVCPKCQQLNAVEVGGCARCGGRLTGREALVTREFEQGLRRLGIDAPPAVRLRQFPSLQQEGRVYVGCVAPRLPWGPRAEMVASGRALKGSFFVTEKSLVFASSAAGRRIGYGEIRKLQISAADRHGRLAVPRMRIQLDAEELTLSFPVETERPTELASLVTSFVTNKRYLSFARLGDARPRSLTTVPFGDTSGA